jgi:hypothetical protein
MVKTTAYQLIVPKKHHIHMPNYVEKYQNGCDIRTAEADRITQELSTSLKARITESPRSRISTHERRLSKIEWRNR